MCSIKPEEIPPPRWCGMGGATFFHGLRCASPVATILRPHGAKDESKTRLWIVMRVMRDFFFTGCAALHNWLQACIPSGRDAYVPSVMLDSSLRSE